MPMPARWRVEDVLVELYEELRRPVLNSEIAARIDATNYDTYAALLNTLSHGWVILYNFSGQNIADVSWAPLQQRDIPE